MQQMNVTNLAAPAVQYSSSRQPSVPSTGRNPMVERKISDPSSASPRGERYPIPSFFEYRIKPKEFDPL